MNASLRALLALLLTLALTAGCNSGGESSMRERLPVIELSPSDLCGGLAAGCSYEFLASEADAQGSAMTEITVFNPGEGPLEIREVRLTGNDAGAYSLELADGLAATLGAGEPYRIAPLAEKNPALPQEVSIRVRYTPVDGVERPSSTLIIENNSTNKTTVKVGLSVREAPPKIQVSPEVVDFGRVEIGDTGERTINVLNVGGEPLSIEALELSGSLDFTVSAGGQEITAAGGALSEPLILPANTVSALHVRFEPSSTTPADGTLLIYSDDPGISGASPVLLLGNQTAPCVNVHPLQIDFGVSQVGTQTLRPLEISACGGAPLTVTGVRLSEGSSDTFLLPGDVPSVAAPWSSPSATLSR